MSDATDGELERIREQTRTELLEEHDGNGDRHQAAARPTKPPSTAPSK